MKLLLSIAFLLVFALQMYIMRRQQQWTAEFFLSGRRAKLKSLVAGTLGFFLSFVLFGSSQVSFQPI